MDETLRDLEREIAIDEQNYPRMRPDLENYLLILIQKLMDVITGEELSSLYPNVEAYKNLILAFNEESQKDCFLQVDSRSLVPHLERAFERHQNRFLARGNLSIPVYDSMYAELALRADSGDFSAALELARLLGVSEARLTRLGLELIDKLNESREGRLALREFRQGLARNPERKDSRRVIRTPAGRFLITVAMRSVTVAYITFALSISFWILGINLGMVVPALIAVALSFGFREKDNEAFSRAWPSERPKEEPREEKQFIENQPVEVSRDVSKRIGVQDSPTRCPYCHDAVVQDEDDWVACGSCLARHHFDCWTELGRCGTCSGDDLLRRPHRRRRRRET